MVRARCRHLKNKGTRFRQANAESCRGLWVSVARYKPLARQLELTTKTSIKRVMGGSYWGFRVEKIWTSLYRPATAGQLYQNWNVLNSCYYRLTDRERRYQNRNRVILNSTELLCQFSFLKLWYQASSFARKWILRQF